MIYPNNDNQITLRNTLNSNRANIKEEKASPYVWYYSLAHEGDVIESNIHGITILPRATDFSYSGKYIIWDSKKKVQT